MRGFRGSLETISLADILQLLNMGGKTGTLSLTCDNQSKEIFFREGSIIYALSTSSNERLGQIFLKKGIITSANLDEALRRQKKTGDRLGAVLRQMNVISEKELSDNLRFQVEEVIYNAFSWKGGEFDFKEAELPEFEIYLDNINTEQILMEGMRRLDEWSIISRVFPSLKQILTIKTLPDLDSKDIKLRSEQFKVLTLVDGKRTIQDICDVSVLGEFYTCKSLYDLYSYGLLEKRRIKDEFDRISDEEEDLLNGIYMLYSTCFQLIDEKMKMKVGASAEKVLRKGIESVRLVHPAIFSGVDLLEDGHTTFESLLNNIRNIPQQQRMHLVMSGFNLLLSNQLEALENVLGRETKKHTIHEINRELAEVLRENRYVIEKTGVEDDLKRVLRY